MKRNYCLGICVLAFLILFFTLFIGNGWKFIKAIKAHKVACAEMEAFAEGREPVATFKVTMRDYSMDSEVQTAPVTTADFYENPEGEGYVYFIECYRFIYSNKKLNFEEIIVGGIDDIRFVRKDE